MQHWVLWHWALCHIGYYAIGHYVTLGILAAGIISRHHAENIIHILVKKLGRGCFLIMVAFVHPQCQVPRWMS